MIEINTSLPNASNKQSLSPADRDFVDLLNNRLTMFGQLSYNIPEKMYIECIKSSAKWFYKYAANANYRKFLKIKTTDLLDIAGTLAFTTTGYKSVHLHPSIRVVKEIHRTNKNNQITSMEVINNVTQGMNTSYYGQSLLGINNNLYITEAFCKMVEENVMDAIMGESIPFDYNPLTNDLYLFKNITTNIMLETLCDIPLQNLYNDSLFERHVTGCCKRELKRLIAAHVIELPGNATVSAEEICNNLEDIEAVETAVKASSGMGDIIMRKNQ